MTAAHRFCGSSARALMVAAGLAASLTFGSGAFNPAAAQPAAAMGAGSEVVVGLGKSQVLEIPEPYTELMIADPKIADVLPLSNRSVYVVGKGLGSTGLTVYGPGKRLVAAANIVVGADVDGLKARLNEILPQETAISIKPANQSLVMSGTVSSGPALKQALALAETYAPGKVVNMMSVEGVQQVMLSVRFVEMSRSAAKGLRISAEWDDPGSRRDILIQTGESLFGNTLAADVFGAIGATIGGSDGDLTLLLDALESKGLVKTLAEPNLVAMSGDTADFLAGGEFPIPVAQSNAGGDGASTITVEFKRFGIGLAFTPTVLQDGLINLVVKPEVSSIDPTISVDTGLIQIPGLRVRTANTTVELRDGESFTIAGLLSDDYRNEIRQFPLLGDLPILGPFFRSTGYERNETELVIVVTPHLVTPRKGRIATPADKFIPPSDFELFLLGSQTGSASSMRPEDRALLNAGGDKGGVEGPFGHVLY